MEVGGSSNTSCSIAFGDNVNALCPTMMMPSMTSHNAESNALYLPLLPTTNNQNLNLHKSPGNSSVMVEEQNNTSNNNNITSTGYYFMGPGCSNHSNSNDGEWSIKAKIMAHPHYHRLLTAYVNCQKIGAPPEVVARLEEACSSAAAMGRNGTSYVGEDPALDQFMEAYCEMLIKYEQELSKPFKEAMLSLSRIESQLKAFTLTSNSGDKFLSFVSYLFIP
ncbi:homeobox SBH1-like [Olea europaea subsp. europaea]|uniref:Homeobox SBH1-like n=1 Tax=Olea europaea subsp. europaea TaxID=158383 RepID=A0A8S0UPU0_OLEEU|nr:homeobox SBH1-like [Olea europaea subsp. europaea]